MEEFCSLSAEIKKAKFVHTEAFCDSLFYFKNQKMSGWDAFDHPSI